MYKSIVFVCPDDKDFGGSDLPAEGGKFHWNRIGGQSVSQLIHSAWIIQSDSHLVSLSVRQFVFDLWTFACVYRLET